MNEAWLWWGLLFGSFGLAFFVYGKKQRAIVPLTSFPARHAHPEVKPQCG
jgi:hypothetical protein